MSVLRADDHEDFLVTAVRHLEAHYEVVDAVGDGQALLEQAAGLAPDVVVLDITMPGLRLKAARLTGRIIFLTMHADPDYVRAALAAGALGYVIKSRLASDLSLPSEKRWPGRPFVSPSISP